MDSNNILVMYFLSLHLPYKSHINLLLIFYKIYYKKIVTNQTYEFNILRDVL